MAEMKLKDYSVPGKRIIKLLCVTADNNNKYYNLFEQSNNTFIAQYGRVQGTEVTHTYPISDWDKIYKSKTKKGYNDVTHLFKESFEEKHAAANTTAPTQVEIANRSIKALFDKLMGYAKKTVAENYTVTQDNVTQAMVDEAQKIINVLSSIMSNPAFSVEEFNANLLKLYTIIPRRMSNVRDHLIRSYITDSDKKQVNRLMDNEQSILDTMSGQVELIRKQREAAKANNENAAVETKKSIDMLETLGLEVAEVNDKEIEIIKKMMGPNANQYRTAFRVLNRGTQSKYDANLESAKNKTTELFWHGSRNENWFNILQTGLLIRPSGAVHSGSMFGDGIYGANKAQKSIGYTSLRGSCWAGGSSASAYLALFEFHIGNQKHITHHNSDCYTLNKQKINKDGFDSVYAHGGADLRNDEFIVYDPAQVTVKYIIEIGS